MFCRVSLPFGRVPLIPRNSMEGHIILFLKAVLHFSWLLKVEVTHRLHMFDQPSPAFIFWGVNRYTIDGGASWRSHMFSPTSILARDVVTQPGERLPIFVIYGSQGRAGPWKAFHVNMTTVLGR